MKWSNLRFFVSAWLFLTSVTGRAATNLVDSVLQGAKFHGDMASAKFELQDALTNAAIVVRASVLNSDAVVWASTNETHQGWGVRVIHPEAVLYGKWGTDDILMSTSYSPSVRYGDLFPPLCCFTNGDLCFFFLKPDTRLSRWCNTNVFMEVKSVPIR